jgi:hypothetical protein
MMEEDFHIIFASLNVAGAMVVAILMVVTTPESSVQGARYNKQALWGLIRRCLNISFAGGMFGMALWVFEGWIILTLAESVFWSMIVLPIGAMLMLRAAGVIDQDRWMGFRGKFGYFNQVGWFGLKGKLQRITRNFFPHNN